MLVRPLMRHIRFKALAIFEGWIFFPVMEGILRIVSVFSTRQFVRISKLKISGPPDFLELCKSSVERLASLDPKIHRCLTIKQRLWVSYTDKQSGRHGPPWVLLVNEAYASWQTDGVIAQLVYMFFYMESFPSGVLNRENQVAVKAINRDVLAQTKAWLDAHTFPEKLAECFVE
jgi:hypothetical protein